MNIEQHARAAAMEVWDGDRTDTEAIIARHMHAVVSEATAELEQARNRAASYLKSEHWEAANALRGQLIDRDIDQGSLTDAERGLLAGLTVICDTLVPYAFSGNDHLKDVEMETISALQQQLAEAGKREAALRAALEPAIWQDGVSITLSIADRNAIREALAQPAVAAVGDADEEASFLRAELKMQAEKLMPEIHRLEAEAAQLREQLAAAKNELDNLKEIHGTINAHVAESCQMLGLKLDEVPCDSWALRERCSKLAAATQRAEAAERERDRLERSITEATRSKHGASGMCCALREQEQRRAEAAEQKAAALQAEVERLKVCDADSIGKNGRAVVRTCTKCGREFTRFSVESDMHCQVCDRKQLKAERDAAVKRFETLRAAVCESPDDRNNWPSLMRALRLMASGKAELEYVQQFATLALPKIEAAVAATQPASVEPPASEPAPAAAEVPICPDCEGTGYAPNCTSADRDRGDLWACLTCGGSGAIAEPPATAGKSSGQVCLEAWRESMHAQKMIPSIGQWNKQSRESMAAWEAAARAVLGEPRWIPVSESLPEIQQNVLFIVDDSPNMDFFAHRMLGGKYIGEYGGFSVPGLHFGDCVTHWMPMPPAPEQPAAVKESEVRDERPT